MDVPGNVWRKFSVVDLRVVLLLSRPYAILLLLCPEFMGGMGTGGCPRGEGSTSQKSCHNNDFLQEAAQEKCCLQESLPGGGLEKSRPSLVLVYTIFTNLL